MTVTLIGMPAVGKSSLGKSVAKKLGMKFIDPDKTIENRYGKRLQEIIDEFGLDEFKKIEDEVLSTIDVENAIIAPGGSAVYYERAMQRLKSVGPVIYLSASLPTIKLRLGDFSKRGVVLRPDQTIDDVYRERIPLFERYADYTIDCDSSRYNKFRSEIIYIIKKSEKSAAENSGDFLNT